MKASILWNSGTQQLKYFRTPPKNMPQLMKECGINPSDADTGNSDVNFLNADTNNDIALIAMVAIKN
ncbi:MAG: hypothetical protein LBE76_08450 [Nitrososphaerota archaeon]|nr:hypothetical protein [Nitrososphaerota archaeon]